MCGNGPLANLGFASVCREMPRICLVFLIFWSPFGMSRIQCQWRAMSALRHGLSYKSQLAAGSARSALHLFSKPLGASVSRLPPSWHCGYPKTSTLPCNNQHEVYKRIPMYPMSYNTFWFPKSHRGTLSHHPYFSKNKSLTKTIQLLGYPIFRKPPPLNLWAAPGNTGYFDPVPRALSRQGSFGLFGTGGQQADRKIIGNHGKTMGKP